MMTKLLSAAVARLLTAGALIAIAGSAVAQQPYPSKPIHFISPYAPGGTTGALARLVGQKLSESWGQPVIAEDRGGANTIIGTEALVKSNPDGYTILAVASTHVIIPTLLPTSYDPIRDFAPVATLASTELVLVINPSISANNLQEFITLAKSKPGQLNYASPGTGGGAHLAAELFNMMAGIKMQHIPYKGAPPAVADLIAGRVQMFFTPPFMSIPLIKSGRIKAMAISGETHMSAAPQVPTFTEAGLPGFDVKTWFGVLAPSGTPKPIIDKLSAEIARILAMSETREYLAKQGFDPFISTPEQFAALMKADKAKYERIIKVANIKLEN